MAGRGKRTSVEANLPPMMYGYGDAKRPDPRSVKLVETMVRQPAPEDCCRGAQCVSGLALLKRITRARVSAGLARGNSRTRESRTLGH